MVGINFSNNMGVFNMVKLEKAEQPEQPQVKMVYKITVEMFSSKPFSMDILEEGLAKAGFESIAVSKVPMVVQ